jgi:hypothetical protein
MTIKSRSVRRMEPVASPAGQRARRTPSHAPGQLPPRKGEAIVGEMQNAGNHQKSGIEAAIRETRRFREKGNLIEAVTYGKPIEMSEARAFCHSARKTPLSGAIPPIEFAMGEPARAADDQATTRSAAAHSISSRNNFNFSFRCANSISVVIIYYSFPKIMIIISPSQAAPPLNVNQETNSSNPGSKNYLKHLLIKRTQKEKPVPPRRKRDCLKGGMTRGRYRKRVVLEGGNWEGKPNKEWVKAFWLCKNSRERNGSRASMRRMR